VAIIGSGAAGLSAAIEARRAGASTIVLEASPTIGGSTSLSGGVVMAAGTEAQRKAGFEDSEAAFYDRYQAINRWSVEPALAHVLCSEAGDAVARLMALGVEFSLVPPNSVEATPRGHMAVGGGAKIARALELEARRIGAVIRTSSRVASLDAFDEGWALGYGMTEDTLHAEAVVIASGGFGHSRELLERFYPDVAEYGERAWSVSAPTCVGDGLELGRALGAQVSGENKGLALITPGFAENFEVVPPGWLVLINREGRRFVDETLPYSMLAATTRAQTGGSAFAIFDEQARSAWRATDRTHAGLVSLDWNRDVIADQARKGGVFVADSLEALAAKIGARFASLETTVATYNADCARGEDSRFLKSPEWMQPIAAPPFFAAEVRPCLIALTCCGLSIDPDARVLRGDGTSIENLFAAGETTAGVMREYCGSGNSISNALVFGSRAGRGAARSRQATAQ